MCQEHSKMMDTTKPIKVWKVVAKRHPYERTWMSIYRGSTYEPHKYFYPDYQHKPEFFTKTKRKPLDVGFLHFFVNEEDAFNFIQHKYMSNAQWDYCTTSVYGICACIIPCGAIAYKGTFLAPASGVFQEVPSICATEVWIEDIRRVEPEMPKINRRFQTKHLIDLKKEYGTR